jgi:tRNA nucleotidyltransferase (CCA-adding enzyme)
MTTDSRSGPSAGGGGRKKPSHASRGWELFAHDADIGVRGFGETREAAFEEAACALSGVVTDIRHIRRTTSVDIVCNAPNDDMLLYEWLNAIVYEMAARDMIFGRFAVQIHDHGLTGQAWGEEIDVERHQPAVEVKGATMTELHVARDDRGRWTAQCVVDV